MIYCQILSLQASVWELKAPLSQVQQRAIEVVSGTVSTPPLPAHLASTPPPQQDTFSRNDGDGAVGNSLSELDDNWSFDESVALQNSSEFFKWLSELEGIRAREAEEKFARHGGALQRRIQECDELLATIDGLNTTFEELKDGQRRVNERTAALHETCERLVADRQRLMSTADALSSQLKHFDQLEKISAQFHATALNDKEENILQSLVCLDESLKFVKAHMNYADAPAYSAKYTQLQTKALAAVKNKIRQGLLNAAQSCLPSSQIPEKPADSLAGEGDPDQSAELTLLNVRFRAAAQPSVGVLLKGIEEASASSPEYEQLLQSCITSYSEARLLMLKPLVTKQLGQVVSACGGLAVVEVLRSGWNFLLQVAHLELQLFQQFFPGQSPVAHVSAKQILEPLCTVLTHQHVRPLLAPIKDFEQLSEIALVLRSEIIVDGKNGGEKSVKTNFDGPEANRLMDAGMRHLLAELQQKMVQKAHDMVRDLIVRFKPAAHDLNYPAILLQEGPQEGASTGTDKKADESPLIAGHFGWYPPVSHTVMLLTKLHPVVPPATFHKIAHESITAALAAVQEASRSVTLTAGPLHGQLFVVRQLLLLRLHVPAQDSDVSEETLVGHGRRGALDLIHVQDYLKRAISGRLFPVAKEPLPVEMSSQHQSNPKSEVDRAFKGACENLVLSMTRLSVEPALNFLTKVTAVCGSERSRLAGQGRLTESAESTSEQRKSLREHAFATPERVTEIVKSVNSLIKDELPKMLKLLLKVYRVPVEEARQTIYIPLKNNILNAISQMATLLKREYTSTEVEEMGLLSVDEVQHLFRGVE